MQMPLEAAGPYPGMERQLSLFGQFVGDWVIVEDRFLKEDSADITYRGELHWRWILEGRATQDVWMMFDEERGMMVPIGSTVRFYDSSKEDWQSIWIVPSRSEIRLFRAHGETGSIVLESTTNEGHPEHWVFFDIKHDSFKWRAEESHDNGRSWKITEIMNIMRMTEQ